jgi:hypothetical protein
MKTPRDLSDAMGSRPIQRNILRETFRLPLSEARKRAKQMFEDFPTLAYMTSIESCREFSNGRVLEMTLTRLEDPIDEAD